MKRSVRRSQAISPFGPGAIYDFGDESLIAVDTTLWPKWSEKIELDRLARKHGVSHFKLPVVAREYAKPDQTRCIEFMRFPTWLFCPSCRSMIRWDHNNEQVGKPPECNKCNKHSRLVPMRFVAVCKNAHIVDIDWPKWAHSSPTGKFSDCKIRDDIRFETSRGRGGGLASLQVRCASCDSARNLGDLPASHSLKSIGQSCPGKHPWQNRASAIDCKEVLHAVQRGASNTYFSRVDSALDLPSTGKFNGTDDLAELVKGQTAWPTMVEQGVKKSCEKLREDGLLKSLAEIIADDLEVSINRVFDELEVELDCSKSDGLDGEKDEDIRLEEWKTLCNPELHHQAGVFEAEYSDYELLKVHAPESDKKSLTLFRSLVERVVLVRRLRIVRALTGFQRDSAEGAVMSPSLGKQSSWLPGIEIYGEGIFITLSADELEVWEKSLSNESEIKLLDAHEKSFMRAFLPLPTPRFLLLHTLSHLLIRQLCFECGYSSSSLAERIYCSSDSDMAGILIYTASSDSEGALGGLVRQGEMDLFWSTFKSALLRGRICSNDPVCMETTAQGVGGLNLAACHSCALLAETSCESANLLLDRKSVYGGSQDPGFFQQLTDEIMVSNS